MAKQKLWTDFASNLLEQGLVAAVAQVAKRVSTGFTATALLLGLVHALVDMASGFLVFRDVGSGLYDRHDIIVLVVLYNSLAFGGQAVVGWFADWLRAYRSTAVLGVLMQAAALLASLAWIPAGVVLVGIGNALFHVGAGAFVLEKSGNRATESGVFVGPGAVGLCAGLWLGGHDVACRDVLVTFLILAAPFILLVARSPKLSARGRAVELRQRSQLPSLKAGLLLLGIICAAFLVGSVTVRALVGGSVAGTWRGVSTAVMVWLAIAACGGKMLGGIVADRLGWSTVSVAALLLSAPLISLFVGTPACAIVGMLVFQMTMAVTLKATHHVMPKRPGLAFGLPCFALLAGALPGLLGYGHLFRHWPLVLAMTGLSALLIAYGLRLLVKAGADGGPSPELAARLLPR